MNWFFWILISVVTTAGANIFQRVLMREKDSDPYGTAVVFQFATGFLTGLFALWSGFVLPPIGRYFWNFLGSTFCWGIGSLFLFYAYQALGSSEIAILSAFGSVVTIITSILFLGERFTIEKTVGTVLVLSSILIISRKKGGLSFGKGTIFALIATVLYGLAVTNDAFILRTYNAISYTSVILFLPGFLLIALRPKSVRSFARLTQKKFSKNMALLGIFYSVQAVAYYVALQRGTASQVAPIYKANIILTVLLAMVFLKEKDHKWSKLLSTVLVTIGVLLIK